MKKHQRSKKANSNGNKEERIDSLVFYMVKFKELRTSIKYIGGAWN